jgi:hypothetical protein
MDPDDLKDDESLVTFRGPYQYSSGSTAGKWWIKIWSRYRVPTPGSRLTGSGADRGCAAGGGLLDAGLLEAGLLEVDQREAGQREAGLLEGELL